MMATADRVQKGLVLKQAREAKGISLEAVQDATKIPLDSLKAIEQGYRVRTLTDFYYRAFIKLYARYLGLDVKTVLDDYQPEKIPQPTKFHKGKTIWEDEGIPIFKKENLKKALKVFFIVLALFACLRLVGCWMKARSQNAEKSSAQTANPETKKIQAKKIQDVKKSAVAPSSSTTLAKTPAVAVPVEKRKKQKINLTVRSKKTTWISVRVDGVDLARANLAKGAAESWQANDSIEISGQNLGDLEFELNGQAHGPFGRTHSRIRKIIVNQDGFKVEG